MIGIYAHHAGSGHLHRCRAIQAELTELAEPSVIFSSAGGADIHLPMDVGETAASPSVNGTLHWAPTGVPGHTARLSVIAEWINRVQPRAFFVDVSVEVAVFVRLLGIPVATLAMPGVRDDPPHQLGYAQAAAIIAAWPEWVPVPEHLGTHAERLHAVGGISRLLPRAEIPRENRVIVLQGKGGDNWEERHWAQIAERTPHLDWEILGGANRVADPMPKLRGASVVIAAAGQNSIADIAAAGTPAIILPQPRPFAEQEATARTLADAGLALVPENHPALDEWPELIEKARHSTPQWQRWQTQGAAHRAAKILQEIS
ncbi:undecaprenyldiphospho-muramoylpentapeptide beta-N- acetylglucosaminyltransferase [Corynebacterium occultum]|uniref:Undecaprenyldiphospho-muramoylpentapeptide beta-N-acetylglucosaminyltransferase n=1 Tax=Corynebacterium occultum TaxID=2675219 RepID=A0A6B8VNM5_9CORY|nr:glycosyltransferase [Corynebacterium occultum]QGU07142.1 undecaprenyldiphospho-muramoylpentapeptide beta-N- acetylglucosaminyltransferase [Corynebacterium occultum]